MSDSPPERDRLKLAAQPFGWVAVIALAFMVLVTTADVFLRSVYYLVARLASADAAARWVPVLRGNVDLMELALAVCIFVSIAAVFFRDEHIAVDLIDGLKRRGLTFALRLFSVVLAIGFLGLSLVQMIAPALDKLGSGEGTMTLQIPRYWHWLPILAGFAFSLVAALAVAARLIRRGRAGAIEKTKSSVD